MRIKINTAFFNKMLTIKESMIKREQGKLINLKLKKLEIHKEINFVEEKIKQAEENKKQRISKFYHELATKVFDTQDIKQIRFIILECDQEQELLYEERQEMWTKLKNINKEIEFINLQINKLVKQQEKYKYLKQCLNGEC